MNGFSQIVSVSELARKSQAILTRATAANADPVILFKRNKPIAAIVDFNKFSDLLKAQEEKEMKEFMRAIVIADKEYKKGETKVLKKAEDLWEEDEKV